MMNPRRSLTVLVAFLAAGVIGVACGDDEGDAPGADGGGGGGGTDSGSTADAGDGGAEKAAGEAGAEGGGAIALGKVRMTVDGKTYEADGALEGGPTASAVGAYFKEGPNANIGWEGSSVGTFSNATGKVAFVWNGIDGQYQCRDGLAGSACSVTLAAFGPNRGDRGTGTFAGTFVKKSGMGPDTIVVTDGAFDLTHN